MIDRHHPAGHAAGMPRTVLFGLLVAWLALGGANNAAAQPTSEGHPHKWLAVEQGMTDFVAAGFELKAVVYDTSQVPRGGEPDVHYFLQKATELVRCDFRRRGETSIYWCYRLTKPKTP
jgi:hypothetical protein